MNLTNKTLLIFSGTFKLKKTDYKVEGFNPYTVSDRMYYLDPKKNEYLSLDKTVYDDIASGKIRF